MGTSAQYRESRESLGSHLSEQQGHSSPEEEFYWTITKYQSEMEFFIETFLTDQDWMDSIS